ncbi:MAG TPA: enolase C-terminal domain-like protein [Micropepsaceae bacterium]|jgi:L-alanine-DL-glutamate epimerase-like enolase superfamily enzyme
MIVARVLLEPCVMRKDDPKWRFALGASPVTEGVVVTLVAENGVCGFGYGSATPHMGATRESLMAALTRFVPLVTGRDCFAVEEILQVLDADSAGHHQAKAAIDCALHDLNARLLNIPLHQMFGGKLRDSVPILRILAIKTPDEMATQAQKLADAGYRYLKVKVHGDVKEDVARVRAIRRQVGDAVRLTIDANQSYSVKDAISALTRMDECDIDLAEQPVAAGDLAGLKLVTESVPVTVEADESAASLADVMHLVSNRIVDAVSLKIPKLGGLRNTLAAARICEAGHVRHRMGAAVGSRLLSAHAMHLAATLPGLDYACELGEFDRLKDDPFEGIEIENGHLRLPQGPGSGVRPRDVPRTLKAVES